MTNLFEIRIFSYVYSIFLTPISPGPYPSVTKGTTGVAELDPGSHFAKKGRWEAVTAGRHGGKIIMSVWVPVDAPVGMWEAIIETWYGDKAWSTKRYVVEMPV